MIHKPWWLVMRPWSSRMSPCVQASLISFEKSSKLTSSRPYKYPTLPSSFPTSHTHKILHFTSLLQVLFKKHKILINSKALVKFWLIQILVSSYKVTTSNPLKLLVILLSLDPLKSPKPSSQILQEYKSRRIAKVKRSLSIKVLSLLVTYLSFRKPKVVSKP